MITAVLIVALGLAEPTATEREQARTAFESATTRFAAADYEAALAMFREAYRLAPHDKVRFNMGQCLIRLGRHREAFVELDAAARSTQLSDDERKTARVAADESARHLATLRFSGGPERPVVVDGELQCMVPCTLMVDPGPHRIEAEGVPSGEIEVRLGETTNVDLSTASTEPPAPEVAPPPTPVVDRKPPPAKPRPRPSALTWVGLGLAVTGGAGIIGFGVRANALHDDYVAAPDPSTRERGVTMRNLANASIGVALLGAVLMTADLIRLGVARRRSR
jgi:tetratricopeptide (TPR) repeat protein